MERRPYIGKWITTLYRMGRSYFDHCANQYGISSSHIFFLLCLYKEQGMSQDSISKCLNIDKGTTARISAALEALGYVTRQEDLKDKRAYKIFLTEKGSSLEPSIRLILKSWADIMTADFTDEEKTVVYQLLQRMTDKVIAAKSDNWTAI
jgi:DNA-binding MarR family transcriptional regulator